MKKIAWVVLLAIGVSATTTTFAQSKKMQSQKKMVGKERPNKQQLEKAGIKTTSTKKIEKK